MNGRASFEVGEKLGVPRDIVSPHFKPLERLGFVERTQMTRVNPRTKQKAASIVWVVTDKWRAHPLRKEQANYVPARVHCPHCGKAI